MIVETQVDCVDDARSEYVRFEDGDVARPDLAGRIRAFLKFPWTRIRPIRGTCFAWRLTQAH
jgi:hypothetical protein